MMTEDIFQQHLANIQWAVTQPPLLHASKSDSPFVSCDNLSEWLGLDNQSWEVIADCIQQPQWQPPKLLGHRFEAYWHLILNASKVFKFKLANQQIIQDKRTIGELDALVLNQVDQRMEHWEFSCKFYMLVGNDFVNASHWVGPNHSDSFGRKLNHTMDHQLPLLRHPATQQWLDSQQFKIARQRVVMQGRLFIPMGQSLTDYTVNFRRDCQAQVNPKNISWWCTIEQLGQMAAQLGGTSNWLVLEKLHWMASSSAVKSLPPLSTDQVSQIVTEQNRPTLLFHVGSGNSVFVVSNEWLTAASASVMQNSSC